MLRMPVLLLTPSMLRAQGLERLTGLYLPMLAPHTRIYHKANFSGLKPLALIHTSNRNKHNQPGFSILSITQLLASKLMALRAINCPTMACPPKGRCGLFQRTKTKLFSRLTRKNRNRLLVLLSMLLGLLGRTKTDS